MASASTPSPAALPRRRRGLRLPEGLSAPLVALLEQSEGEEEEGGESERDDENGGVVDGGAPRDETARPLLSPSERAAAFASAPSELELLADHPAVAAALLGKASSDASTTSTAETSSSPSAEAAAVEAFVHETPALSSLAEDAAKAEGDLRALEETLRSFGGSLGEISSDIRGLQSASAALATRLRSRRAAAAALAEALDALALPPSLCREVSEGDPASAEYASALEDLGRRARKLSGKGGVGKGATRGAGSPSTSPAAFPLRASRAAREVLPQLDALRRAAAQRSVKWLLPAIQALRAPRTNVHVLQRNVLAPRRALVSFLREFGGDDYFSSPGLSSSSLAERAPPSGPYGEVRRCYVETLSQLLARHLRRYVSAVGASTDAEGGSPPLVGTGERASSAISPSSVAPAGEAAVGGAAAAAAGGVLSAIVDAVAQTTSSTAAAGSHRRHRPASSRPLDVAERGAILLHLDRPALVPGAFSAANANAGGSRSESGPPSAPSTPTAARQQQQQSQNSATSRKSLVPPEEAFRSVCRLLADTATAEFVFCVDFFGGDGAFRDGFGGAPLSAAEGFLLAAVADADDPVALLLMSRVVRHFALEMSRRRCPALDSHYDRLTMAIWPRLQHVLDAHVSSLSAVESGGVGGVGVGLGALGGLFGSSSSHHHHRVPNDEPALPGGAVHPLASRSGSLEGALLSLSSPAEAGQLSMSLRRLRAGALRALRKLGERDLSRATGGGAEGRAEAAAFVAGNAHAVLGLLEGAAADAAARGHAVAGGEGGAATATAPFTSPVFSSLGDAGAESASHWHAAFDSAALEVASEPLSRWFPGLLEAARALRERGADGDGRASDADDDERRRATSAAREAISAAFSPSPPHGQQPATSWSSSLDAVRADVARRLRKNPPAARAAASLAARAVSDSYSLCHEAVASAPPSPASSAKQQQQWPSPSVVARECARQ